MAGIVYMAFVEEQCDKAVGMGRIAVGQLALRAQMVLVSGYGYTLDALKRGHRWTR